MSLLIDGMTPRALIENMPDLVRAVSRVGYPGSRAGGLLRPADECRAVNLSVPVTWFWPSFFTPLTCQLITVGGFLSCSKERGLLLHEGEERNCSGRRIQEAVSRNRTPAP